jgi:hypothetical protein
MQVILRLIVISASIMFITGCVSFNPLKNINDQAIERKLSEEQVKEAIHSGIEAAGWIIEKEEPGKILASYSVRVHTVAVNIKYTKNSYSINYAYSNNMKAFCSDKEESGKQVITKSDFVTCGDAHPQLIHKAYEKWVQKLKSEIIVALSPS